MPRGGQRTANKAKTGICENCGAQFVVSDIGREPKYCSSECKYESALRKRGVKLTCNYCGENFISLRKDALYCSRECSGKARGIAMTKETHYRTEHTLTCAICGKEFKTIYKNRICCSQECGWKYQGENAKKYYKCQYCGKTFYSRNGFRMKYCSRECSTNALFGTAEERAERDAEREAFLLELRTITTTCAECGEEFQTTNSNRIYCSKECGEIANRRQHRELWAEQYEPVTFSCKGCGTTVTTTCGDTRREFCCQSCATTYARRKEHATARHKESVRELHRRRDELIRKSFVEEVDYDTLYERDNGCCQICGLPVLYDKLASVDWSGSIDHIVPLSRGGEHSMNNCQLAHRICNSLKLDSIDFTGVDWEVLSLKDNYWKTKYDKGMQLLYQSLFEEA